MAMIQTSFEKALQKGSVGEDLVRSILEQKGFVVYTPKTEGGHAFDMLAIKDKSRAIAVDVKSKARMNKLNATGIDRRCFDIYKAFSEKHNMPFWVVFIDEMMNKIYGNTIEALEKPIFIDSENKKYPLEIYTKCNRIIRLWSLEAMIIFRDCIPADIRQQLIAGSQRSYKYNPNTTTARTLNLF